MSGTATLDSSTSHGGTNSVKTFSTSSVTTHYQAVLMAPGQTLRVQAWVKAAAGSTANLSVGAFRRSDGSYVAIGSLGSSATPWTQVAADVTIPTDTTGEIHVELSTPAGQTAWWDDVSLFTTYATTTYAANGLVTDRYGLNGASATGLTRTHVDYGATSAHPGITATEDHRQLPRWDAGSGCRRGCHEHRRG